MNETPQNNPEQQNNSKEKFLNQVKDIFLGWKRKYENYKKTWDLTPQIKKSYEHFKNIYENIKNKYENIKNISKIELENLKNDLETIKKENIRYESISTISIISKELEKKNKNGELDKVIKQLWIAKNLSELIKDKTKVIELLDLLKKKTWKIPETEEVEYNYIIGEKNNKLSEQEKTLYWMLDAIKNFYGYAKERWVEIDFKKNKKDLDLFYKEQKSYEEITKKYNKKEQKSKNKDNHKEKNNSKNEKIIETTKINDNTIYNPKSWIITITWKKIKTIKVPEYDKKILKPDNIENYIKIDNTLSELGMTNIKPYLPIISAALWEKWEPIRYNDNFLDKKELMIILNYISIATWFGSVTSSDKNNIDKIDFEEFKNLFKNNKNKKQILGGYKDDLYKKWKSPIEETFLHKFVLNKPKFDLDLFKKEIQTQKKS